MTKYTDEEVQEIERASWYIRSAFQRAILDAEESINTLLEIQEHTDENRWNDVSGLISYQLQWMSETIFYIKKLPEDMRPSNLDVYEEHYNKLFDRRKAQVQKERDKG